jgi:hypothetical protein
MMGFATRAVSHMLAPFKSQRASAQHPDTGEAPMSERIRTRYIGERKLRPSTRHQMRECGVLDDWKECSSR